MPDTRTYYVLCEDNCRFESLTREQIYAAIESATGNVPTGVDDAFITQIQETNAQANLKFWVGTQAQYNALSPKPANTQFFITDSTATADAISSAITTHNSNTDAHPTKQDRHKKTTATLLSSGWTNHSQTVSVSNVTDSNTVIVSPAAANVVAYGDAGIYCSAQANNELTFTCLSDPASNITVNVIILD